jgi:hypothetical protein
MFQILCLFCRQIIVAAVSLSLVLLDCSKIPDMLIHSLVPTLNAIGCNFLLCCELTLFVPSLLRLSTGWYAEITITELEFLPESS